MKKVGFVCLAIFVALLSFSASCFSWDIADKDYSKVRINFVNSECPLYLDLKLAIWDASAEEYKFARGKSASGLAFNFRLLDVEENSKQLILLVDDGDQVIWHIDKNLKKQALSGKAREVFSSIKSYIRGFKAGLKRKNVQR
jgi:hypothetical protein